MALPDTREGLTAAGYEFDNESRCRKCGKQVEWWITPNDKRMPFIVVEIKDESKTFPQPIIGWKRVPHFADCPGWGK
jgi:hypothetical protein